MQTVIRSARNFVFSWIAQFVFSPPERGRALRGKSLDNRRSGRGTTITAEAQSRRGCIEESNSSVQPLRLCASAVSFTRPCSSLFIYPALGGGACPRGP